MDKKDKKSRGIDLTPLCQPGVYKVLCIPRNCAYFAKTSGETIFELQNFFLNLMEGFCKNERLLADYKLYGDDNFFNDIVVCGPEYHDKEKLEAAFQKAKSEWPGELY